MQIIVALVIAVSTLAFIGPVNGDFSFIPRQYGQGLNITCLVRDMQSHDLKHVMSLVISKYENNDYRDLVSADLFMSINNNLTDGHVFGHVGDPSNSTLTIQWLKSDTRLNGNYTCTLYGLGHDNLPHEMKQELALILEDLDPVFSATPTNIEDELTPSLIVECSLTNVGIYQIHELDMLDLFHTNSGTTKLIASFNGSQDISASTENGWTVLGGYFDKKQAIHLEMRFQYPTASESGMFTCDISARRNISDPIFHITRTVNVTFSDDVYQTIDSMDGLQDYYLFACNFENGICGLNISKEDGVGWILRQSRTLGEILDQTTKNASGHFLQLQADDVESYEKRSMETKLIRPIRRQFCVSFWFLRSGRGIQNITVYTREHDEFLHSEVVAYGGDSAPWNYVRAVMPQTSRPFVVGIQAQRIFSYGPPGFMAIDDIAITDLNCI